MEDQSVNSVQRFLDEISSIRIDSSIELSEVKVGSSKRSEETINGSRIAALIEGRGGARGEIGIAFISTLNPTLSLSQISDSVTYVRTLTKLAILEPEEVIFPIGNVHDKLFNELKQILPKVRVVQIQRKYYNSERGIRLIDRLCVPTGVELQLQQQSYCLAATSAVIDYTQYAFNAVYAPNSIKVSYHGSEQAMLIDFETSKHIELLHSNLPSNSTSLSLFGCLNRCSTPGGVRLLRSTLFQPPIPRSVIEERQEAVQELIMKAEVSNSLQSTLGRLGDLERLFSPIVFMPSLKESLYAMEKKLSDILSLKQALDIVPQLKQSIGELNSSIFKDLKSILQHDALDEMSIKMNMILQNSVRIQKGSIKSQHSFSLKTGFNAYFDLSREVYSEIVDELTTLALRMSREHDAPIKLDSNASRGFHLFLSITDKKLSISFTAENLPSEFLMPKTCRNGIRFTTEDVLRLNQKCNDTLRVMNLLGNKILNKLVNELRMSLEVLYKLSEQLNLLDVLLSFAQISGKSNFIKPVFGEITAIRKGRHPILDMNDRGSTNVVANNIYFDESSSFNIITGSNMSGKSTYLKQIVLLQIMAQIGCYIPAEFAIMKIMDAIYTRIGTTDNMEANMSTLMTEMKEMSYILSSTQSDDKNNLIIIDELGRGTASDEGSSLCWAMCEEILNRDTNFGFLATHFKLLSRLEDFYPNVTNYHFVTEFLHGPIQTYTLVKGVAHEFQDYGLEISKQCGMPTMILQRAKQIAAEICDYTKTLPAPDDDTIRRLNYIKLVRQAHRIITNPTKDVDEKKRLLLELHALFIEDDAGEDEE